MLYSKSWVKKKKGKKPQLATLRKVINAMIKNKEAFEEASVKQQYANV